jgi:YHS domain-containing protein
LKKHWLVIFALVLVVSIALAVFVIGGRRGQQQTETPDRQVNVASEGSEPESVEAAANPPAVPPGNSPNLYADMQVRCATHPQEIRPLSAMSPVDYKGQTYYVCCQDCVSKFKADPEFYIRELRRVEQASGS